jgi:hypothetical protein
MSKVGAVLVPPVTLVDDAVRGRLGKDPLVVDWLIGVSENLGTRAQYLDWLARFLNWTSWGSGRIFELKREALMRGEPVCEVKTGMA